MLPTSTSADDVTTPCAKKVKLCAHYLRTLSCGWGDDCYFAHKEDDLSPDPNNAVAWIDGVGVAELQLRQFGIIHEDEMGCLNVICNRNTSLGNPFVTAEPAYDKLEKDGRCGVCFKSGVRGDECNCLIGEHHALLCDAFREFWEIILATTDAELDLPARTLAETIAERRGGLLIGRRWAWHAFTRRSIVYAFKTLCDLYINGGERLVLLCHCGVANASKPCHAVIIQQRLVGVKSLKSQSQPSKPHRTCEQCDRNWLWRGALDADKNKYYCAVCWCDFTDFVYAEELKHPLPDAPLLQPLDEEP